ncbi:MAG: hypothetical protein R3C56_12950 [Pirellulaceae bacterium]
MILSAARDPLNADQDISRVVAENGDWVMLCREQAFPGGGLGTICRWYRVLTLDIETDITAIRKLVTQCGFGWTGLEYSTSPTPIRPRSHFGQRRGNGRGTRDPSSLIDK